MNKDLGTDPGTATVKESVHKLASQGGETIGVVKERATEMADQVKQQYSAAMTRAVDFVQARPFTSLGLGLGLGFYSRTIMKLGAVAGVAYLVTQLVSSRRGTGADRVAAAME